MSTFALDVPDSDLVRSRSFARDERGAVMLMGVFFASFLVASLWYMIGIGQALVFREIGQEIADSAALSSAGVHAQGMNFISALNLIQLIFTVSHLVFAFIFIIICLFGIASAETIVGAIVAAVTDEGGVVPIWNAWDDFIMFTAIEVCAVTQTVTSGATPWLGSLAGADAGGHYSGGKSSYTLSPSMVPTLIENLINPGFYVKLASPDMAESPEFAIPPLQGKLGLPVQEQAFSALCERVFKATFNWVVQQIRENFIYKAIISAAKAIKHALDFPVLGGVVSALAPGVEELAKAAIAVDDAIKDPDNFFLKFAKGAGAAVASTFLCNSGHNFDAIPVIGPIITKALGAVAANPGVELNPLVPPIFDIRWNTILGMGPKQVWGPAENGSQWNRIWGFQGDLGGGNTFTDMSSKKVAILGGAGSDSAPAPAYFSQAEYYFDCDEAWSGEKCNQDEASMYSMRWTARLRQSEHVDVKGLLASVAVDAGGNILGGLSDVLKKVKVNGSDVDTYVKKIFVFDTIVDTAKDNAKDAAKSKLDGVLKGGKLDALH